MLSSPMRYKEKIRKRMDKALLPPLEKNPEQAVERLKRNWRQWQQWVFLR